MSTRKRPKIAILAALPPFEADPQLPKPKGHYAVWLSALFQALEKEKAFEFHWITLDKDTKQKRILRARNQIVHILPRGSKTLGLFTLYVREKRDISRALREISPDMVHAWGTEDCYAYCAKDFTGSKLLSTQGLLTTYKQRGPMPRFARLQSLYEIPTLRAYQHITVESPWASDRVKELVSHHTIHHVEYAVQECFWGKERHLSSKPTALYGGTDTPLKNIGTLIQAFRDPRLSHVTLYLAGVHAENHPDLPSNIICLGRLNRQEMAAQLSTTWCLVHASLADCAPNIANEARVMGVPVIISTECGGTQHVENGKSGFIFPPKDAEALIHSVQRVTRDHQTALTMGAFQQEQCRRALCAETMCRKFVALYHQLLS